MDIDEEKQYLWFILIIVIIATVTFLVISFINREEIVSPKKNIAIDAKTVVDNSSLKLSIAEVQNARDKFIPKCAASELCKKILSPYNYITIKTPSSSYTLHVVNGEITEIILNSKQNPDVLIKTTDKKVREAYNIALTNDYPKLLATVRSDIPLTMYTRALQAIVS